MVPFCMAEFLRGVNGKRVLKAFLAVGALVVPAWSDAAEGHRLKMAVRKTEASGRASEILAACKGRPGAMAILPPGLVMVDLDVKEHVNGWIWLATHRPGWHPSRSLVTTPNGGAHIYMRAEGVRTRPGHAPGVDVFGAGSVVTFPGSSSPRGAYTAPKDFAFVRAPAEIVSLLPQVPASKGTTSVQHYRGGARAAVKAFSVYLTSGGVDASNISGRLNRQAYLSGLRANEIAVEDLIELVDIAVDYGMDEDIAWSVVERGYAAGSSAPRKYRYRNDY